MTAKSNLRDRARAVAAAGAAGGPSPAADVEVTPWLDDTTESADAVDLSGLTSERPARPATSRAPSSTSRVRVKPVKVTVEMPPVDHAKLKRFCASTADDLGLPLVAGAEVFRLLWDMTQRDPQLRERLVDELRQSGGSRRQ